jgi:putative transposase
MLSHDSTATAPNQLWVTDLTFVPIWAGIAYVCFLTDAFSRMIVGWRVASHMRTTMVLDAFEMARWPRGISILNQRKDHNEADWVVDTDELQRRLTALPAETFPHTTRSPAELTAGKGRDRFDFAVALMIGGLAHH